MMTTPAKPLTADEITDWALFATNQEGSHISGEFAARIKATIEQQSEQIEKLRKALQFYADHNNWINDVMDIGVGNEEIPQSSRIYHEGCGHTAEQALASTEPVNDKR